MKSLRVAAIIPLYNGSRYIGRALTSVLEQTRPADQIVVVDDGSSDDGAEVARRLAGNDPRFSLLTKDNGGQSSARNFGTKHSDCDLVAFLDQDDWWYPQHIETLEKPFLQQRSPSLGWVYSNLDEYDDAGRLIDRNMLQNYPAQHPKRTVHECLLRDMMVVPSASLISRQAFDEVNGFDERLSGYEDDDFFLRVFVRGYDNIFINRALSAWRIHDESSSYSDRMDKSGLIYALKLLDEWPDRERRKRYLSRDLISPRFANVAARAYFASVRSGNRDDFRNTLMAIDRIGSCMRFKPRAKLLMLRSMLGNYRLARLATRTGLDRLLWRD